MRASHPVWPLALLVVTAATALRADYSNDFTSQSEADFTRYQPLAGLGAGGTYSFPGSGGFRIQAAASPLPGLVGPGRAGILLNGPAYGDFTLSFEILNYSTANAQFVGAFGRVTTPGLGTLNGYALGLDTLTSQLLISRVTGEQSLGPIGLTAQSAALTLNADVAYVLEFSAIGTEFSGRISEKASGTVLATVSGTDATYAGGVLALGAVAQSPAAGATAGATFGNLAVVTVPEPSTWALALGGAGLLAWSIRNRRRG